MKLKLLAISLIFSSYSFSQINIEGFNIASVNKDDLLGKTNRATVKKHTADALNILFANTFNSALFGSNDVSVSKYYATLTNEDNEFSFGVNFNFEDNKLKKDTWLFSAGGTLKSKSGFATIYKNSQLQNNIYGNLKVSYLGRGIITFDNRFAGKEDALFNGILFDKYEVLLDKYIEDGGELETELERMKLLDIAITPKMVEELIKKKANEFRCKIAEEEVKAINEFKMYKRLWDHTFSFSAKLPVSATIYNTSDSVQSLDLRKQEQYLWEFNGQYTSAWKFPDESKVFLTFRGRLYNNNNVETAQINSADFLSIINQSSTNQAITESNDVYIGEFNNFVTGALAGEFIYYPFNWWLGISGSLEQSFGTYDQLDWKLGIPVVLKDKKGKPTLNMEFQWKEVNKNHLVGLRFGFVLGKFNG